ncbi:MAG: hypothetical protein EXS14_00055 [Planctomycetes bacterium]|nr:hypothetical protein [Planctomycetota bacterium]
MNHRLSLCCAFLSLALSAQEPPVARPVAPVATPPGVRAAPATLQFERDITKATDDARSSKRLLLWVIMKDGEIGCSRMLQTVYADAEVRARLTTSFVLLPCSTYDHGSAPAPEGSTEPPTYCSQFVGVLCPEHQAIEREMRKRYEETVQVVAPQHIITDADGKVLARHRYELKKKEFLAFLDGASGATSNPVSTDANGIPTPDKNPATSRSAALLETIQRANEEERCKAASELCTLGDKAANTEFVTILEKLPIDQRSRRVIRAVGEPSCAPAALEFTRLFAMKDTLSRNCAVVSVEEMADSVAAPALLALWKTERDDEIRKDILRALGPCGVGVDAARELLMKEAKSSTELLRVGACIGLGHHTAGRPDVRKLLLSRYEAADARSTQRLAVIYAWSLSRNSEVIEDIDVALEKETNGELKDLLNVVKRALGGTVEAPPRGRGRGGEFAAWRALGTLLDKDRVERNAIKNLRARRGLGG